MRLGAATVRIFVHDYCGHPFQVQLSRWLAEQGHAVHHCYSADIESPRGNLIDGQSGLTVTAIGESKQVPKYTLVRRGLQERRYANSAAACLRNFRPDVVISGNTPPTIQRHLQDAAGECGAAFVYWLQDIYSSVLDRALAERLPIVRPLVSPALRAYEFAVVRRSDAVVVISEDFVEKCVRQGLSREKIVVQHNWAPLPEITLMPKDNVWAREHDLADKFVFLFSGTLGLKHNPRLISSLAEAFRDRGDIVISVVSQGIGRRWLEDEARAKDLGNMRFFDFQPFQQMSCVLGSADVLMAILEPFAGELSVPSKILSYMCARRPILAALPAQNLASRIIKHAGAGLVVSPTDQEEFIVAAKTLSETPALRSECAAAARNFAERNFDIEQIGARFVSLFEGLTQTVAKSRLRTAPELAM